MRRFLGILFFCLFTTAAFSQCLAPDDPNFDPFCVDVDAPIDSGVGLLIGAAALYTIKKIREKKAETGQKSGLHS